MNLFQPSIEANPDTSDVEILYIEGCPNVSPVRALVTDVAAQLGVRLDVREQEIYNESQAEKVRFRGSPSVLIGGQDIEPDDSYDGPFAISCRTYGGRALPPRVLVEDAFRSTGYSHVRDRVELQSNRGAANLVSVGGIAGAFLASACCWLPLSLAVVGVSLGGLGSWFEFLRPYALLVAGAAAGTALHLAIRREPIRDACDCGSPGANRRTRIMAGVLTGMALASAAIPDLLALFDQSKPGLAAESAAASIELSVQGMTCAGCAVALQRSLREIPEVAWATVDFDTGYARVWPEESGREQVTAAAISAIAQRGFDVRMDADQATIPWL